jgi:hypothetical protein
VRGSSKSSEREHAGRIFTTPPQQYIQENTGEDILRSSNPAFFKKKL